MRDRAATLVLTLLALMPVTVYGQSQTLTAHWDANPPTDLVTAYQVCLGTTSGSCSVSNTKVPSSQTSFTFTPTPGTLYHFTVRAISAAGMSNYSTEVQASIPNFVQPATQRSTINVAIAPLVLNVVDPDGGPLQFSDAGLPFGLSLNPTTGRITGIPTTTGNYSVTISVFDGLVTVFKTFNWIVGDVTPPILAITSHVSGQLLSSANVTLRGTATDFGAGGSGVTSVTVNGQPANGGSATGNGIANWDRSFTLSTGSNTITVKAMDGASNISTTQITLNVGSAPPPSSTPTPPSPPPAMTGASLSANRASPQPAQTAVTFTASGAGGRGPYQYQWYAQQNGGPWQLLRAWSTTTTFTWTPAQAGNYIIALWARSAGATANAWQAYAERAFVIGPAAPAPTPPPSTPPPSTPPPGPPPPPMTSASLVASLTSPRAVGSQITFTASGSGGAPPYQYRWYVQQGSGPWQLVVDWSYNSSYTWRPTVAANYTIAVWGRSNGSPSGSWEAYAERSFVISTSAPAPPPPAPPPVTTPPPPSLPPPSSTPPPPMLGASLGMDKASPQRVRTKITFRASGYGGLAPYQYRFYVRQPSGTWQLVRDWNTGDSYAWTPTAVGNYVVAIWGRSYGSTSGGWEAYAEQAFTVY